MTPDERKRGLRAAVDAKLKDLLAEKKPALDKLSATAVEADRTIRMWENTLAWVLIDALVDECATYQNAGAVLLPAMQYRCLWEENMASMDGPRRIPFSGRVGSYEEAAGELENRRKDPKFRNVLIEARPAQAGPWPHPWDFRPADTPKYPGEVCPRCTDIDAHLCLAKRGACNMDDLRRYCCCECHQADKGKE